MLLPLQEQAIATATKNDVSRNDSDSSSIDIANSDTDEEGGSEQDETIYFGSDHAYSIKDPIPVDLKSYTYKCNNILDKNASKMQELVVWGYKRLDCSNVSLPVLSETNNKYVFLFNLKRVLNVVNDPLFNNHVF